MEDTERELLDYITELDRLAGRLKALPAEVTPDIMAKLSETIAAAKTALSKLQNKEAQESSDAS